MVDFKNMAARVQCSSPESIFFVVDFRDYQLCDAEDPSDVESFLAFVDEPARIIGLSCMANLLPFTILSAEALNAPYPYGTIVLGGVGPTAAEHEILTRFPWIDIISWGEGELTRPELLEALTKKGDLAGVAGISYGAGGEGRHNPRPTAK